MNMELWPLAINSRDAVATREVKDPEQDLAVPRGWFLKFLSWFQARPPTARDWRIVRAEQPPAQGCRYFTGRYRG